MRTVTLRVPDKCTWHNEMTHINDLYKYDLWAGFPSLANFKARKELECIKCISDLTGLYSKAYFISTSINYKPCQLGL